MACMGTGHVAEAPLRPSILPSRRRMSKTASGPIQYRLQTFPLSQGLEAAVADAIAEEIQQPQRGVAAQTSSKGLRRRPNLLDSLSFGNGTGLMAWPGKYPYPGIL